MIHETEFSIEGFKERYDIQEWIADNPNILGEELFIIAKEFNEFDKTRERTDLLALDREGNLVVIELKRDDTGEYSCAMKSQFRKQGNHESGTGNHTLVVQCLNLFA
ncbi:hypothetical protein SRRS_14930 [Sporomusa rhizae]|uniref:hypothetical protein n=1 Tax=Sporomusa rhizae TaxID=357999 RepID=UPI00352B5809